MVNALIKDNVIYQGGGTTVASNIILVDSSTGSIVTGNHCAGPSAAVAKQIDVGNAGYGFENYADILPDLSGVISPATA